MRFLPDIASETAPGVAEDVVPGAAEDVVRVRVLPAWLRIDARFGSVFRRRGDPAAVLR
jgi:hypothetical protein